MIPSPLRALAATVAVAVVAAAGCSSAASTRTDSTTHASTTAASVALGAKVPAGTVLRVGDQLDYLKTVLSLAGQDQDFPYKVEYSAFVGGPSMLQAFQAGAIDTGFVGSTPLIFAQAANQDTTAVAGWGAEHSSYGLLTKPGETSIRSWSDLKGKTVAFQEGTAGEAALIEQLDLAHLSLSDITPVKLAQTQITAALQGGSADAGVSIEPLTSVYLAKNPTARQVATSDLPTDRASFVIAAKSTLDDTAKTAALGDYVARLVKSFTYLSQHPDLITSSVYVKQYGLPADRAAAIVKAAGKIAFFALPGAVGPAQQHLADLFQQAGAIPTKVVVGPEFDTRFNQLVAQAQAA